MRKNYIVGDNANEIKLQVTVGTPGLANTKVFQFLGGGQYKKLKESDVDSGNIPLTKIGPSEYLVNTYLKIRTVIDFGSIDKSQWIQLVENIDVRCQLNGGFAGVQHYIFDRDDLTTSLDKRIAIIDLEIDLKTKP